MLIGDGVQIAVTLLGFIVILVKYKTEFDLHKKILEDLIKKVDAINTDVNFMKGFLFGKNGS